MRLLLLQLHKYTGLILGLLLSITGLSGSMVVFDRELDEFLTPVTADFEPADTLASFNVALDNARAAVNNGTNPTRLALGRDNSAPHIIRFPTPPGKPGPIEVSINPGTADVLAVRHWGEYPVTWFYHLHLAFLGEERGELLVGFMGICLLFFCLSGLVIWWPGKSGTGKRNWYRALTISRNRGAYRFNFDLHKSAGIYFFAILLMLAITGIEIVWHEPVHNLIASVLPVDEEVVPQSTPASTPPISMDAAALIAQGEFPQADLVRLYVPAANTDTWRVTFRHPEDWWAEYSTTTVYVDQFSGEVLQVWDGREQPVGNKVLDWLFPLHNGDALGLPGRIVVFLAGLMPSLLFGTGVYLWWRKRRPIQPAGAGLRGKQFQRGIQ